MAQIGELIIALEGDSSNWSNALKRAGQDLKTLGETANKAGQDISKFNAQTVNLLKGWKNEVGDAYRTFDESLKPVKQSLVSQGKALKVNSEQTTVLATKAVIASQKMRDFSNSLKGASSSLWLMSMGLQQFGRAMTMAFTVPIGIAAGLAVKTFTDWEKGTVSIQRAAEITREEANKIEQAFIKISQQVPITVAELQEAGFAAAQAGVTGEKGIVNFANAAVRLSKVGGDAFRDLPIEKLANDLAKLSIAFGVTGENMEEVNNVASMLLVVAKAVPGGLAEIIEAMRRAAGSATAYGLSIQTTTALVGTLVAAAVPASRAGTELGRVFERLVGRIDLVGEALGYTGDDLDVLKERMQKDMGGVLIELIGRLGQTEDMFVKNQVATEIFGEIGKKALLPLANNYELLIDLQSRANQELESGALLTAEFDTQANTLSGTMQVFKNNLQILSGVIGRDLAPYISYFLKTFTLGLRNLIERWQQMNPHVKFAIFLVAGLLAVVGPLAMVLHTLFISPIAGIVTFLRFTSKLIVDLGATATMSSLASVGMTSFAGSMTVAAGAIGNLIKGLALLSIQFAAILVVIGLVVGALYLIGKALGIRIKFPEMPSIKMPKYKGLGAGAVEGAGKVAGEEGLSDAEKDALKKKEKALARELRDKRKLRNKELRALDKGVRAFEKVRDAEIKARQKLVDEQRYALEERREEWEEEREIAKERQRIQEEIVENAKDVLKTAKKALKEIKKARDAQMDVAENAVDYAEMNLKAAQNALKREVLLGHDEFDASYRLAEERVKHWENVVMLAEQNVIAIKRAYQEQIDAQEAIVDSAEEQVDIQTDALDDLKDALKAREAIVRKEIDVIQDELSVRQKSLKTFKNATQEKLDLLREERQVIRDAWDDEISILQDRLDDARDQAQAIADMPLPELPDLAERMGELEGELQNQLNDLAAQTGGALRFGIDIEEGGLWYRMKAAFTEAKEKALEEGQGIVKAFFTGLLAGWLELGETWDKWWMDKLFGEGTWQGLREEAKSQGKTIMSVLFQGLGLKLKEFGTNWIAAVFEAIFGIGTWDEIHTMSEKEGKTVVELLWEGILFAFKDWRDKVKNEFEEKFIQPIREKFPWLFSTGVEGGQKLEKGLKEGGSRTESTGRNIIANFIRGLRNYRGMWTVFSNVRMAIYNNLGTMAGNAWSWGYNLVINFKNGMQRAGEWIEGVVRWIGDLIKRYWGASSPPKMGPLKEIDEWGKNLARTYAESIQKGMPYVEHALESISGDIGTNIRGGRATVVAETRAPVTEPVEAGPAVTKNYYIQPGQMIATRGEIRNFIRILKEYDKFEEGR